MLNKTPLLHQSFGPRVFFLSLSLSLSFRLILWSTEALWVHFPASASKTLSRRRSAPSPLREGNWSLGKQSQPHVRDFTGFLHKPRNISLFLSPLLSYHQLQTTRFWSIKDLNTLGAQSLSPWTNQEIPVFPTLASVMIVGRGVAHRPPYENFSQLHRDKHGTLWESSSEP